MVIARHDASADTKFVNPVRVFASLTRADRKSYSSKRASKRLFQYCALLGCSMGCYPLNWLFNGQSLSAKALEDSGCVKSTKDNSNTDEDPHVDIPALLKHCAQPNIVTLSRSDSLLLDYLCDAENLMREDGVVNAALQTLCACVNADFAAEAQRRVNRLAETVSRNPASSPARRMSGSLSLVRGASADPVAHRGDVAPANAAAQHFLLVFTPAAMKSSIRDRTASAASANSSCSASSASSATNNSSIPELQMHHSASCHPGTSRTALISSKLQTLDNYLLASEHVGHSQTAAHADDLVGSSHAGHSGEHSHHKHGEHYFAMQNMHAQINPNCNLFPAVALLTDATTVFAVAARLASLLLHAERSALDGRDQCMLFDS